jgi:hypothetical protein
MAETELIVYACPLGTLADQLDRYMAVSLATCGPNTAHRYMPHCTLTGFFHDQLASVPWYASALAQALASASCLRPAQPILVTDLIFKSEFHGLLIEAEWLRTLIADFASRAGSSPTRRTPIRLKDGLHLSLAYGFPPETAPQLQTLAEELVTPFIATDWELRLYERQPGDTWVLHWAQVIACLNG